MAFQIAEAFVEFKARGQRDVEAAVDGIRRSLLSVAKIADGPVETLLGVAGKGLNLAGTGLSIASSGIASIANGIRGVVSLFAEQERAIALVNSQLRATGGVAGFTSEQLQQMATDLQQVTTFGDETTLAAQRVLLSFTNIRGDVFRSAIESAMDMSTVLAKLPDWMGGGLATNADDFLTALSDGFRATAKDIQSEIDGLLIGPSLSEQMDDFIGSLNKVATGSLDQIDLKIGDPASPSSSERDQPQPARMSLADQVRQHQQEQTSTAPTTANTTGRFNIADLAGNIQSSILSKQAADTKRGADAAEENVILAAQAIEIMEGFGFGFQ